MSGPLTGVRIVELAGLGPAPFCGMVLSDLGAEVVRVDRPPRGGGSAEYDLHNRGKRSIAVDLKNELGREIVLRLVEGAEALIEGFRPGVTERLGLGPDVCLATNTSLTYARVTGWGQQGPWSSMAGHDIDYIALSGVLNSIGDDESPVVPLNLVGDFGGGGMLCAVGVLAGILQARATGVGQVVDAAMVDGSALLMTSHHGFKAEGWWTAERNSNLLDGAAPFYRVYGTSDGKHIAVGALEPQFFAELLRGLGIDESEFPSQNDREQWPAMADRLQAVFSSKTRDQWAELFEGTDACVAPVLDMDEAATHAHNKERSTFVNADGVVQPAPAPRFSATLADIPPTPPDGGQDTDAVLSEMGYSEVEIGMLRQAEAIA